MTYCVTQCTPICSFLYVSVIVFVILFHLKVIPTESLNKTKELHCHGKFSVNTFFEEL